MKTGTISEEHNYHCREIVKQRDDLQFSLDKEVRRVMALQKQHDGLLAALKTILQFDGTRAGVGFDMKSVAREAIAKAGA